MKQNIKRALLSGVFMAFAGIGYIHADAQVAEFAGSTVVSQIISDLTADINSIIDNVDYTVSSNAFQTRQHGQILIDQIGIVADKTSGKLFKDLRATERQALNDLRTQIDKIERLGKTTSADLRGLNNSFAQTLGSTVIGKKVPRVTYYTPEWVSSRPANAQDTIKFEIEGFMLSASNPTLVVGATECKRVTKISTKLSFECPAKLFNATGEIKSTPGRLTVYEKKGFFRRTLKAYNYDIGSYIVPNVMGRYSLLYYIEGEEDIQEDRSQSFSSRNSSCQRARTGVFNFSTAGPEWKIVPGSAKASCKHSSASSCNSVRSVTPDGFQFTCRIANNGNCIKTPFGTIKDARGSCRGTARWKEVTQKSVKSTTDPVTGDFIWGKDIAFEMPSGTKSFKLTVEQSLDPDRQTRTILTESDTSNPWYELRSSLDTRTIVLSPRGLAEALAAP